MGYTLTGAATLGFDLVRQPYGADIAAALRTGLTATPEIVNDLATAALRHPVSAPSARRIRELAAYDPISLASAQQHTDDLGTLAAHLELAMIGNANGLDFLVRTDLLPAHLTGSDTPVDLDSVDLARKVIADYTVAAFAADRLPKDLRTEAQSAYRAYQTARAVKGVTDDTFIGDTNLTQAHLGPHASAIATALSRVASSTPADHLAWDAARVSIQRGATVWSAAMHDACWAAHLADRTRATASAVLATVTAFRQGGFTPRQAALGAWNDISGTIQAIALADLISDETYAVLTETWRRATGSVAPRSAA